MDRRLGTAPSQKEADQDNEGDYYRATHGGAYDDGRV